jgi:iron complex outermembrane recepter protein
VTTRFLRGALAATAALALAAACAGAQDSAPADTLDRLVELPEVLVNTARAGERAPVARATLTRAQIRERNWGQDTPMALATLPGAYAYSDAGNGIGYSYLSIRGFPQRRISVLVNGVPLNDPQSHEVYWIDHPDLLASASEVQLQRGVGAALYGAASVGGTVAIETAPFTEARTFALSAGYGTWNTRRWRAEASSGRLDGDWSLHARYSRVETDGYRDASWSKLWSYAIAARKLAGAHAFRLNLYGGPEETHLAYLGVPRATLEGGLTGDADRDRRFNPITYPLERDHFFEPHYELIHSWAMRPGLALTQTLFWFDGAGHYDERRLGRALADFRLPSWTTTDPTLFPASYYRDADANGVPDDDGSGRYTVERFDVVRRRAVENRHVGWVPRLRFDHAGGALTVGGELRHHDGRHWGEIVSGDGLPPGTAPDHRFYDYHPRTLAAGVFLREEWSPRAAVLVTADLGWRRQEYRMRGDRFDGIRFDQSYDFALPRLGVTWTPRPSWNLFAAYAHASREPAFRDLYDAEGAGSVPLYRIRDVANNVYADPLIRPERVHDVELGASWRGARESASAHLYRMDFRDELVYAGQFDTDLGYPILGNAARSVRQGVELAARARRDLARGFAIDADLNASFGDHHFVEFREQWGPLPSDAAVYDGNAIGFSPATLAHASLRVSRRGAWAGATLRHAGRIYLDSNESAAASIAPHTVLDLIGGVARRLGGGPELQVSLRVFNALDRKYETGGYMDYDAGGELVPHFVPAATRSVLGEVRIEW